MLGTLIHQNQELRRSEIELMNKNRYRQDWNAEMSANRHSTIKTAKPAQWRLRLPRKCNRALGDVTLDVGATGALPKAMI